MLKYFASIVFFSTFLLFCTTSCQTNQSGKDTAHNVGRLKIVATTSMLKDAVGQVVKDKADVTALMGAGVDPHLYKATQNDLVKLQEANVVFYNGLYLEGKMDEILKKMSRQKYVFAGSDGIEKNLLIPTVVGTGSGTNTSDVAVATHSSYDPHIWFDVSLWEKVVAHISNELQKIDTANAVFYSQNARVYIDSLRFLHENVKKEISAISPKQRILITSHDAFHYFGKAYDLEVKGLQGISTVTDFGLQDVTNMTDFIVKNKIKSVFVESSVPSKALEAVVEGCRQKGHTVSIGGTLFSDAMGADGTPEGTYVGMVRANVKNIVNGLR